MKNLLNQRFDTIRPAIFEYESQKPQNVSLGGSALFHDNCMSPIGRLPGV
jgi:hypothetical protein